MSNIPEVIEGRAYVVGENVDTDQIIPARYLTTYDPNELAKHALEDLRDRPEEPFLNEKGVSDYNILIASHNFGCGSSREHAPLALGGAGIEAIVAPSFARIFYRNMVNGGRQILPLESYEDLSEKIGTGDYLEIDVNDKEIVKNSEKYKFKDFGSIKEIIEAGGLTMFNKQRMGLV